VFTGATKYFCDRFSERFFNPAHHSTSQLLSTAIRWSPLAIFGSWIFGKRTSFFFTATAARIFLLGIRQKPLNNQYCLGNDPMAATASPALEKTQRCSAFLETCVVLSKWRERVSGSVFLSGTAAT